MLNEVEKRLARILENGGKKILKEQIAELLGNGQEDPRPKIAEVRREIAEIDQKADALLDMMTTETKDFVERKIAHLRTERKALENKLRSLEETDYKPIDTGSMADEILKETLNLKELAAHGAPEERKLFIRVFVEGLKLCPDTKTGELYIKEVPTPCGAGTSFAAMAGAGYEEEKKGKKRGMRKNVEFKLIGNVLVLA